MVEVENTMPAEIEADDTGKEEKPEGKPRKIGPVTDQSGKRKSKYAGAGRFNDFTQLPPNIQSEAERLLENGATFEEATEYVNEHHSPEKETDAQGVTLAAVKLYFQGSLDLQKKRIRRMQEMAQALKKALRGDPNTAQAELAEAVFFTGIMGLHNAGAEFKVKDAQRDFLARSDLNLKTRSANARLTTETLRQKSMRQSMANLKEAVKKESGGRRLGPETLQKIQEIYGLISRQPGGPRRKDASV